MCAFCDELVAVDDEREHIADEHFDDVLDRYFADR